MDLTIDFTSARPAYQQIEQSIARAIEGGTLGPGDRIPPERALAERLGVSRMTVRQAFGALEVRGLVERGVGRGTFVAAPRVDLERNEHVLGFTEQMRRAGLEPGAKVLSVEVARAPGKVARALRIAPGAAVARIQRVRSGGGVALSLEDTWLPAGLFPGIVGLDLGGSLYELMGRRFGRAPVRAVEHLSPVPARTLDAEALGVRPRAPLMLVERVSFDESGSAVEYSEDRHRGDRARFVVRVAPRE